MIPSRPLDQSPFCSESPRLPEPLCRRDRHAGPCSPARTRSSTRNRYDHPARPRRDEPEKWRRTPGQSPIGDLPVPARRAEPDGPVRPQAGAHRSTTASRIPGTLEIHFDKQAGKLLASPFRFRPHGQSGMVLSELVPHMARDRRRPDAGALDDDRSVDHETALRLIHTGQDPGRPADLGLVGRLRAGDARTRTCRPTWSCPTPAVCRSTAFATGRAAGCRRSIRERRSARGTTPVLNLKTPPGVTAEARECQLRLPRTS